MENNVNKSGGFAKKLFSREVLMYLLFGVLTTLVGWAVYFAIMIFGRLAFSIPNDDTSSAGYIALYTVAQVVQWVCAVLFAFFTNKKWVFTEAEHGARAATKQFFVFCSSRIVTYCLEVVVNLGIIALLENCFRYDAPVFSARVWAKVVSSIFFFV